PFLDLRNDDRFGLTVALNDPGDILAVGAYQTDSVGTDNKGAVYLFSLDPEDLAESPIFRQKIAHGTSGISLDADDSFGVGVALNGQGNILAVGAHGDDTGNSGSGAVYLFSLNTNNLTLAPTFQKYLTHGVSSLSLPTNSNFGVGVDLNSAGNILAVGAQGENGTGTAYLFILDVANLAADPVFQKKIMNGTSGISLGTYG